MVDFHATWCGPCHAIRPVYERLAQQVGEGKGQRLKVQDTDSAITAAHSFRMCSFWYVAVVSCRWHG